MSAAAARCFALVPCAGVGERAAAGGPKQYVPLAGQALVAHTLAALAAVPRLAATLVALAPDDTAFERHVPAFDGGRDWVARCGGATRADTVAAGLRELRRRGVGDRDWVLVHDAARCLLRPAAVDRLIDACSADDVGGLLALPLADTLKSAAGGRAVATLPRADKWLAQERRRCSAWRCSSVRWRAATTASPTRPARSRRWDCSRCWFEATPTTSNLTWPADFALAARLLETRP